MNISSKGTAGSPRLLPQPPYTKLAEITSQQQSKNCERAVQIDEPRKQACYIHLIGTVGRVGTDGTELDASPRGNATCPLGIPLVGGRIEDGDVVEIHLLRSRRVWADGGDVAANGDKDALFTVRWNIDHLTSHRRSPIIVLRCGVVREFLAGEVVLDHAWKSHIWLAGRFWAAITGRDSTEHVGSLFVLSHRALIRPGHRCKGRRFLVIYLTPGSTALSVQLKAPKGQVLGSVAVGPRRRCAGEALQQLILGLVVPQVGIE